MQVQEHFEFLERAAFYNAWFTLTGMFPTSCAAAATTGRFPGGAL